jgi:hypothetical protein
MARFKRRPTFIEAEQFRVGGGHVIPAGVCVKTDCGVQQGLGGPPRPHVHTMHANQVVILADGDWVVPESDGVHFYPVNDEVMRQTYERLD